MGISRASRRGEICIDSTRSRSCTVSFTFSRALSSTVLPMPLSPAPSELDGIHSSISGVPSPRMLISCFRCLRTGGTGVKGSTRMSGISSEGEGVPL